MPYWRMMHRPHVKGQTFEDLDLLAKLLAPRASKAQGPLIEVLDSEQASQNDDDELASATESLSLEQREILEAAENDWQVKQELPEPDTSFKTSISRNYGFLNLHSGYFRHVEHAENEVNELGANAETAGPSERRELRLNHEEQKWDEEYYMADYADDEYIKDLIAWKHPHTTLPSEFQYSEEENLAMLRLPRREYLASREQTKNLYLTLLTLLFSYAYESRTTQCDPTPESGWTLGTLTPAFSALDPAPYGPISPDPKSVSSGELLATFVASYRRALTFPLYRSFALAEACRSDVVAFLRNGKRTVLRCLLEMKNILDHHDVYYVYSKIWLDDYCVWIQSASDDILRSLAADIAALNIPKNVLGWDLEELEALTHQTSGREIDSDDEDSEDEIERMLPAPL
ncbi:unnamed protein product [Somion occarium]|uniref:Shq1 C-terminal domain-containing protein n=1 Tax=Somion occarium TaxID=3059160 RepID=A0ABP1DC99_9APHY